MSFKCQFCKDHDVPEDNMICDACAEKEIKLQERDEQYADWYHEQQRIRYEGIHVFDNDVDKISVVYRRKVLCAWTYSGEGSNFFETGRRDVMLTAKGYIEGWCDAIATLQRMQR